MGQLKPLTIFALTALNKKELKTEKAGLLKDCGIVDVMQKPV